MRESRILAGTVSILWSTVALLLLAALAIGLWLYFPGTNAIEEGVGAAFGSGVL